MRLSTRTQTAVMVLISFLLLFPAATVALNNGVARTPPMGWNTFNQWGGNWDLPLFKMIAESLISTGLKDVGYIYVNQDGHNDGTTPFWPGSTGFVNFAKPYADYLHSKGFKFGVYMTYPSDVQRCAKDMADAGVDFVKVDAWTTPSDDPMWGRLRDAMLATGRPIVYSTHAKRDPAYCNMARTGPDMGPLWSSITHNFDNNYAYLRDAQPGYWPDPDMLQVGCRYFRTTIDLTYDESRAHFTMWCFMSAPLLIGFDLSRTHPLNKAPTIEEYRQTVSILANAELIALNQDTVGLAGRRIKGQGAFEVWLKDCADGSKAVMFLNRTSSAANMSISQAELGWQSAQQIYVRDLWKHENLPPFSGTFAINVATHAAEAFKMNTTPIATPVEVLRQMDRYIAWMEKQGQRVFPEKLVSGIVETSTASYRGIFDLRGRMIASFEGAISATSSNVGLLCNISRRASMLVWPGK